MQPNELQTLLNNIAQPAFAAQDGVVVFQNRPAAERMVHAGDRVDALTVADGVLSLAGSEYDAKAQTIGGYAVYFLSPATDEKRLSAAAFHAAQNLREPLTSLYSTFSELFPILEELEDDAVQDGLAHINRAFFRLMRLACNLSDLPLALNGQMRLYYTHIDLAAFIDSIFLQTESLCRMLSIELRCKLPRQPLYIWVDEQKIERLILNLLSNALRFSKPGDCITIELAKSAHAAVITIVDSGEGFAPDVLPNLYSHFDRPVEVEDARYGFGAGLALCRKIAQLHGGSIMLSPTPPQGTQAVVRLPLKKPSPEALVESPLGALDYTGGLTHTLVEFADILPSEVFNTENIN